MVLDRKSTTDMVMLHRKSSMQSHGSFASAKFPRMQAAPTPVLGGATPVLGGRDTPLVGARKVEVMLGLKQEAAEAGKGSMPPPAPRNVRKGQPS